jgi:uncharacterized repeat protein (TIGR01451 family)
VGTPFDLGFGGAINTPGPITATNSTFSGNSATATGGALIAGGTISVSNSTFASNTAVLGTALNGAGGAVTLTNTVLAGGAAANCITSGGFTDGGGTFSTDNSCALTQPSSQVVTLGQLALGSLADNGGPTQTIALGAASVAKDGAVSLGCPATDQRGISRPQGSACDAGAFEVVFVPPPPAVPAATFSMNKGVATNQAGPFAASLTAPLGSTVWYRITLTNTGSVPIGPISIVDSAAGGALPTGCPAVPTSLAGGASYTCTYSGTVGAGSTTNTASATVGGATVSTLVQVSAGPPVMSDSIAPGVNRGTSGFGSTSVVLAKPGYVTYLIKLEPALAGQAVEIWTRSKTGAWVKTTTRLVAADGTIHYFRRISAWTAFWAKLGDASSHGRIATVR